MASIAFTRFKMQATTHSINHLRTLIDGVNSVIYRVYTPIKHKIDSVVSDYPIIFVFVTGCSAMFAPWMIYPVYIRYKQGLERNRLERERVELCLQKGIDPFPTIRWKEHVWGDRNQSMTSDSSQHPLESVWEFRSIENMKKKKEQYEKVMGIKSTLAEIEGRVPTTVDEVLQRRESSHYNFKTTQSVFWVDPVDLVFPRREDELMPSNTSERIVAPGDDKLGKWAKIGKEAPAK